MSSVSGLEKYVGRWDLRGAQLSTLKDERKIEANGHSLSQKFGTLKLKNVNVESIDFSYTDISYSWWQKCNVSNCLFEETKAKEIHVIASDFSNCIFRKANLCYSFINENIGSNSGSFRKVEFIETNLNECIFYFPIIENCVFVDCNLVATNFNGSRIKNCKFKGKVDNPWFKGYPINVHNSSLLFFNRINSKDYLNPMENVDFSEAELIGVSFSHGIDLSKCSFPKDESKYILVRNLKTVYARAKEIIGRDWQSEDVRKGIHIIDNIYFSLDHQNQSMDIIDKELLTDHGKDQEFGERFFNLIRNINSKGVAV